MRILIVEDEPLLRDGLVDLLKGVGHAVDIVGDGLMPTAAG
jgi:DNA-binding response OmpR family regulator